ncbi:MAG: 16S rRNA (cytosine(1402)-N(4))-methyltransferase RsmH [Myxococcales bacterium]|nr:MAG: 16S rRNA (cytosine(1402)-N(4))-methyltransferase RsmH [Myxococcales bacterium]
MVTGAFPFKHVTVLRNEVVEALSPRQGGLYLDVTLGGGGHSEALLEAGARVVGCDRDPAALAAASERLAVFGDRFQAVKSTFSELTLTLGALGPFDGVVADLGVSSPQLDDPSRGMSFRSEGPLDMRMDPTRGETVGEMISRLSADDLADVLYYLGDERRSRRIARCVKQADDRGELQTTLDLRRAVVRAVGPQRVGGVDPATRSFQALRIAVNRELDELETLLVAIPSLLGVGAVASLISFHSLEDRIVKRAFQERSCWEPLTKKPLTPTDEECVANPRSRSAKLRSARLMTTPMTTARLLDEAPSSSNRIRVKIRAGAEGDE